MFGQYTLGQIGGCVTQCLLGLCIDVLTDSATFFVAADQTEAFPYTTKRSKLYWGSQGQEKLLGDLGEKEGRAKVQIGEFIKRQNAGCKEFFLYRNLVFVGELCLQNTLNNVLGRSRQSCPDIRLCSCSGCAFSKEP